VHGGDGYQFGSAASLTCPGPAALTPEHEELIGAGIGQETVRKKITAQQALNALRLKVHSEHGDSWIAAWSWSQGSNRLTSSSETCTGVPAVEAVCAVVAPVGVIPSLAITSVSITVFEAPVSTSNRAGIGAGIGCRAACNASRLGSLTPTKESRSGPPGLLIRAMTCGTQHHRR
jgi:hypothetical protein